jgi:hypothetical protein
MNTRSGVNAPPHPANDNDMLAIDPNGYMAPNIMEQDPNDIYAALAHVHNVDKGI